MQQEVLVTQELCLVLSEGNPELDGYQEVNTLTQVTREDLSPVKSCSVGFITELSCLVRFLSVAS